MPVDSECSTFWLRAAGRPDPCVASMNDMHMRIESSSAPSRAAMVFWVSAATTAPALGWKVGMMISPKAAQAAAACKCQRKVWSSPAIARASAITTATPRPATCMALIVSGPS